MPMPGDAKIRASDADRDRTAAALREHLAAGRLTIEEFDERLDRAYAAKTLGELDEVMADLPTTDLGQLPSAPLDRSAADPIPAGRGSDRSLEAAPGRLSPAWRGAWGSWLAISLFLFAIWVVSGATGGPWFLWVALPLGALILGRWAAGAPVRRQRRSARRRYQHRYRDHYHDRARRYPQGDERASRRGP
jgi:Domain of unknown function (DUF1707)